MHAHIHRCMYTNTRKTRTLTHINIHTPSPSLTQQHTQLPGDGSQLASVSHVEDVAGMISAVVGKEAQAAGQVFNCGTESFVSYQQICDLVGNTVGKAAKTQGYDPKEFDLPKGAFPFRNTPFYVSPAKAVEVLGWRSTHTLAGDLPWSGSHPSPVCVCVCVRARVRACVRACVRICGIVLTVSPMRYITGTTNRTRRPGRTQRTSTLRRTIRFWPRSALECIRAGHSLEMLDLVKPNTGHVMCALRQRTRNKLAFRLQFHGVSHSTLRGGGGGMLHQAQ